MNTKFVATQYGIQVFPVWLSLGIFKVGAIPMTILSLFLIYWALPNRRIPVTASIARRGSGRHCA